MKTINTLVDESLTTRWALIAAMSPKNGHTIYFPDGLPHCPFCLEVQDAHGNLDCLRCRIDHTICNYKHWGGGLYGHFLLAAQENDWRLFKLYTNKIIEKLKAMKTP